ncbi:hypothetical protein PSM7751_04076 [Pseudooceanicola marinus]|uniref:Uncharacterized protein n=1 Tax=Pseudooceanicola marinus TaxID=396013 RepID=A0A1X7A9G1_9RHOB|nr:hypothetical protein PSM7751_04076 [Pseudooceanicola marinus]
MVLATHMGDRDRAPGGPQETGQRPMRHHQIRLTGRLRLQIQHQGHLEVGGLQRELVTVEPDADTAQGRDGVQAFDNAPEAVGGQLKLGEGDGGARAFGYLRGRCGGAGHLVQHGRSFPKGDQGQAGRVSASATVSATASRARAIQLVIAAASVGPLAVIR